MRPGLGLEVGNSMVVSRFFPNASLQIAQIGVLIKSEERLRLFQHVPRRAGMILAHPVGDQIFDRDNGKMITIGHLDELHAIALGFSVQERRADDLEAQPQVWMNPASR